MNISDGTLRVDDNTIDGSEIVDRSTIDGVQVLILRVTGNWIYLLLEWSLAHMLHKSSLPDPLVFTFSVLGKIELYFWGLGKWIVNDRVKYE